MDDELTMHAAPDGLVTGFTERELFVYAPDLSCGARHELAPRGVGLKLDPLDLHGTRDNTYPKRLRAWTNPALLIIDNVGLGQIKKRDNEPTAAHTLYDLIDRRHAHAATAITSNIRLRDWGRYLGDATVTAAILDRLVMQSLRIDIDGPSYRQHVATDRARKAGIPLPSDDTVSAPVAES